MTKPELGIKRLCTDCGARYYDLNTTPIICPKCGARFRAAATTTPTRSPQPAAVRQPVNVPGKIKPTSPDPGDILIEELDEDDEVSEIVGANAKDEGAT
jgi:uncharacterized protein (TIGR02300 family)